MSWSGRDWVMNPSTFAVSLVSEIAAGAGVAAAGLAFIRLLFRRQSQQLFAVLAANGERQRATLAMVDRLVESVRDRDQGWFWTPEWQRGEQEADADLVAHHTVQFDSADDFLADLAKVPRNHPVR